LHLEELTGERSHQVDKDENFIPIDHETAEIIAQQKKLFREKFGREPGTKADLGKPKRGK